MKIESKPQTKAAKRPRLPQDVPYEICRLYMKKDGCSFLTGRKYAMDAKELMAKLGAPFTDDSNGHKNLRRVYNSIPEAARIFTGWNRLFAGFKIGKDKNKRHFIFDDLRDIDLLEISEGLPKSVDKKKLRRIKKVLPQKYQLAKPRQSISPSPLPTSRSEIRLAQIGEGLKE